MLTRSAPVLALLGLLALGVFPAAAAERIAVLPWADTGAPDPRLAWIGKGLPTYCGLLLAAQTGIEALPGEEASAVATAWGPTDAPPSAEAARLLAAGGARAALTGSFQAQGGAIRLQADLYPDPASGAQPLHISLNGKTAQLPALAAALAEIVGEALTGRFFRVLRPPQPPPAEFLPALVEPTFGARDPGENLAQNETFLRAALKIDPNNTDAYGQLGVLYGRHGMFDKALENFTTAAELSPNTPRHHWNLGTLHYLRGQLEEALTEFLQSTVIDGAFVDGFVALGALHRRLGDREASQAALERAVKAGPGSAAAHVALGVNAYLAKDVETARSLFEKARSLEPRSAAASVNLALLAWEAGNLDAARKELERALAAEPSHPEALNDLAILEGERGAADAAADRFRGALDSGAPRAAVLCNLGVFQLQAGQFADAEASFQRVLDLAPEHVAARTGTGYIQLVRGRAAEAAETLAAVREESPAAALASYNLALAHHLRRGNQLALVNYLRALQARRDLLPAHVNLGILFEELGRPEKALTEYLKALSAEAAPPELYTYLGQVYALRGYADMAEETIRKTTLVDPGLPAPWYALATSLERKDPAGAAEAWRRFLEAVRRDRNRAFWVPVAEKRLAALEGRP